MIIVKFNEEGLIQSYIYNIKDIELNNNTILFDEDNYNKLTKWYKQEELQYLFNAEEFKIIGDVDLTLYLKKYEREFTPPFVTNKERIKQLEQENMFLTASNFDLDFRVFEIEEIISSATPTTLSFKNINNELGGEIMTQYLMAKKLILAGYYDRADMEYKLGRYRDKNVITQAQYDELIALMDANDLIK